MPKDFSRSRRIGDQIQRELADLVRLELKDPRVGLVTFTEVEVSQDLSHAKVYFTQLTGNVDDTLEGLRRAAGFLRSQIAQRMKVRTVPELHFVYDTSVERGRHLSDLIDSAVAEDEQRHK
jgi:ribosome-binding factor A